MITEEVVICTIATIQYIDVMPVPPGPACYELISSIRFLMDSLSPAKVRIVDCILKSSTTHLR